MWSPEYLAWTRQPLNPELFDTLITFENYPDFYGAWYKDSGNAYYKYLYWRLFI